MKIITICGKARSGKDTTAAIMKDEWLSSGKTAIIAHYADLLKYICKTFLGWNGEKDECGRDLLQYVGTELFRNKRPSFWVDFLSDVFETLGNRWDYVIIPDCRFENEVSIWKEKGYETVSIRTVRKSNGILTAAQEAHPSETSLDGFATDFVVDNNGSFSDLRRTVIKILKEISNEE